MPSKIELRLSEPNRACNKETGKQGICVNAVAPGLVQHEKQTAPKEFTGLQLRVRSIKRLETPHNLPGIPIYLALAEEGTLVTGQTLVVDGGSIFH